MGALSIIMPMQFVIANPGSSMVSSGPARDVFHDGEFLIAVVA